MKVEVSLLTVNEGLWAGWGQALLELASKEKLFLPDITKG